MRQLTSQSGQVTFAQNYDPYGMVTQSSGAVQSEFGYTGEQQDGDMVYLRSRYYNVADGRFLSRDTWGGDGNNPITFNRWTYSNANPILYTDPSGKAALPEYCLVALGLAAADGPLPFGDATLVACLALLLGGATIIHYVANGPEVQTLPGVREIPKMIPLEEILAGCWTVIRPNPEQTPKPDPKTNPTLPPPLYIPTPQTTPTPEPTYIYRSGNDRPKTVRLYRPEDWKTGLSFWAAPPAGAFIRFKVDTLMAHGYIVKPDGGQPSADLPFFGGGQHFGIPVTLPVGHVTVYYNNESYWTQWYEDEQQNVNTTNVSPQTVALYELREK